MLWFLLQKGGIGIWLVLGCAIIGIFVFIERFFYLHKARIKTADFLRGICAILRKQNVREAIAICDETPGPVPRLIKAAILHRDNPGELVERAVNDAALTEVAQLEHNFAFLASVAQLAPIFGLFGTLLGIINSFIAIQQHAPLVELSLVAGGIWEALISTAAGLLVGSLAYVAYNTLVAKVDNIVLDMERAANEIIGFITGSQTLILEEKE
jgi:biopolymer transport protein ExbB